MPTNSERLLKLKTYYDSLVAQQQILSSLKDQLISPTTFTSIDDEIRRAKADFPDSVPEYPRGMFGFSPDYRFYDVSGVKTYLAAVIARFKAALTDTENTSVTESLQFSFLVDPKLREIIERDYIEIQRGYIDQCWKSVLILSCGSIEAILLDRLMRDPAQAQGAKGAPAKQPDLSHWDLSELIKVAVELKIVEPSAEMLANAVRQYRNLVHPGYELRNKLQVSKLEADSALTVLKMVHRDLSQKP